MIEYIKGDATKPKGTDKKLLIHVSNDIGGWGSGFVLALNKLSPLPKQFYKRWHTRGNYSPDLSVIPPEFNDIQKGENVPFVLGQIQPIIVNEKLVVVNMLGQRSTGYMHFRSNKGDTFFPAVRYGAIEECLHRVGQLAEKMQVGICAPRFGAGLAGPDRDWETMYHLY